VNKGWIVYVGRLRYDECARYDLKERDVSDKPSANPHFAIPQGDLEAFCQRHHIRRLSLFGSALRADFRPDSDVDVLVEFEPGRRVSLLDMAAMEIKLSEMLGRKVDLRTPEELSRYFRDEVVAGAEVQYVQPA
jgi:predicted nucleotidyltransferase